MLFQGFDVLQDRFDYEFVPEFGVDHNVVEGAVGPFLAEIVADELGAVAIYLGDQLLGFFFGFADGFDAADFFFVGGVDENVEGIGAFAQKVGCAAADDDAIAARGDVFNDFLEHLDHAIGVKDAGVAEAERSFITAARIHFEETIEEGVHALVATLRFAVVNIGGAGDFGGDFLVPEFPAEAFGERSGDERAAAAVFAFEGDNFYGHCWCPGRGYNSSWKYASARKMLASGAKALFLAGPNGGALQSWHCQD